MQIQSVWGQNSFFVLIIICGLDFALTEWQISLRLTYLLTKRIHLLNSTGQFWSVCKFQVVKTIPNSYFLAEVSPPHIPLVLPCCGLAAEWNLVINFALPSNGIIKSEHWKLVSSYICKRKTEKCGFLKWTVLLSLLCHQFPEQLAWPCSFKIEYFFEKWLPKSKLLNGFWVCCLVTEQLLSCAVQVHRKSTFIRVVEKEGLSAFCPLSFKAPHLYRASGENPSARFYLQWNRQKLAFS